jgi:glycosyltransferase involved in cell wall biosynthesis
VFFQNPDDLQVFLDNGVLADPACAVLINGSGIDTDEYRPVALPRSPTFLMIARLIPAKGVREYVEAARRIKQQHPSARFKLVGWVDHKPNAITERELELWVAEGTIEYLGRVSDVRPAITDASVYVLPSYREGTPRTVLEAMSMGRAVITTNAAGCRETVRHGENGFLVPIQDVPALVGAMKRFFDEPQLAAVMGQVSRQLVVEKYDVHKVNSILLKEMGLA